mmetsp:Transcript_12534/g.35585  ORF Transcript_12534/g.35585 Transcript_12534/m.35585 type:complete len:128 (-) Transcript_12534:2848-3231(-)
MTGYKDDSDVEIVYDTPYRTNQRNQGGRGGKNNQNAGMIGNYVDFENVFDPFERDQDDLKEFFDDEPSGEDSNEDWEKLDMFNDPRKVRVSMRILQHVMFIGCKIRQSMIRSLTLFFSTRTKTRRAS